MYVSCLHLFLCVWICWFLLSSFRVVIGIWSSFISIYICSTRRFILMQISMPSIRYTRKEMDGRYKTSKPKQNQSGRIKSFISYSIILLCLHYLLSPPFIYFVCVCVCFILFVFFFFLSSCSYSSISFWYIDLFSHLLPDVHYRYFVYVWIGFYFSVLLVRLVIV